MSCFVQTPGPLFTKKMPFYGDRNPHYKPKTVWRWSQVYNGKPYTNKMASSWWIAAQALIDTGVQHIVSVLMLSMHIGTHLRRTLVCQALYFIFLVGYCICVTRPLMWDIRWGLTHWSHLSWSHSLISVFCQVWFRNHRCHCDRLSYLQYLL